MLCDSLVLAPSRHPLALSPSLGFCRLRERLLGPVACLSRVGSREELSVWMCEAHNRVNRQLGKPEYSCKIKDLDLRWRNGGERCDDAGLAEE